MIKKLTALCLFLVMVSVSIFLNPVILKAENSTDKAADIKNYTFKTKTDKLSTIEHFSKSYTAFVPSVAEFYNRNGDYNVVYNSDGNVYIKVLDSNMALKKELTINLSYPLYGDCVCDLLGNYYIISGQADKNRFGNKVVLCVSKYDSQGNFIAKAEYTGYEARPYPQLEWGTQIPFDGGNCSTIIANNVLVCSFAREMYSGHQSNYVIYVDCNSMQKLKTAPCYTSHSFDEYVTSTKDGNYLFADLGDAWERGLNINKISPSTTDIGSVTSTVPFHFREGANRDHGYNETYAQLGGIEEVSTGYALVGASEKTLSFDVAPTKNTYCGYSEARNLFIQILKKDFTNYSGSDKFALSGQIRLPSGSKPSNAITELRLPKDIIDYNVVWLTNYTGDYFCANPHIVITDDDRIVILWEKLKHTSEGEEFIDSYYMILSANGERLLDATKIPDIRLAAYQTPVYKDGYVLWTTAEKNKAELVVHKLKVGSLITQTEIANAVYNPLSEYVNSGKEVCPKVILKENNRVLIENEDYSLTYSSNVYPGKGIITVKGLGRFTGEKSIPFIIKPRKGSILNLCNISDKVPGKIEVLINLQERVSGYQISICPYQSFTKGVMTKDLKQTRDITLALKLGVRYYVKVRSYITVDNKKYFGEFSPVQSIKAL